MGGRMGNDRATRKPHKFSNGRWWDEVHRRQRTPPRRLLIGEKDVNVGPVRPSLKLISSVSSAGILNPLPEAHGFLFLFLFWVIWGFYYAKPTWQVLYDIVCLQWNTKKWEKFKTCFKLYAGSHSLANRLFVNAAKCCVSFIVNCFQAVNYNLLIL